MGSPPNNPRDIPDDGASVPRASSGAAHEDVCLLVATVDSVLIRLTHLPTTGSRPLTEPMMPPLP